MVCGGGSIFLTTEVRTETWGRAVPRNRIMVLKQLPHFLSHGYWNGLGIHC